MRRKRKQVLGTTQVSECGLAPACHHTLGDPSFSLLTCPKARVAESISPRLSRTLPVWNNWLHKVALLLIYKIGNQGLGRGMSLTPAQEATWGLPHSASPRPTIPLGTSWDSLPDNPYLGVCCQHRKCLGLRWPGCHRHSHKEESCAAPFRLLLSVPLGCTDF